MAEEGADKKVPIYYDTTLITEFSLHYRPGLIEFLEDMKTKYELIIYSSLNKTYVDAIVRCIEENEKYFEYIFGEDFCIFANISYGVKCLDFLFGNRTKDDIILVDTTAKSLPFYSDNFVPIPSYCAINAKDYELAKLASLLDLMIAEPSIPKAITNFREADAWIIL